MPDLPLGGSKRKRLTGGEAISSSQGGGSSIVSLMIVVVLAIVLGICFLAPNQVDHALNRTVSSVAGKGSTTNQVWNSIVSTLTSDDVEREQTASSESFLPDMVLQQNESVATGSMGRTVLTRGNDILTIDPKTTIIAGESGPDTMSTIIRLIDGTIHVKAAKRTEGETLSIETQYLVATVKGTKFDVTTSNGGTTVTVTEGVVSVRSTNSTEGIDVTPGNTAVVSAAEGAMPIVGPTLDTGAPAATGTEN